jgi:hypothetical protein
MVGSRKRTEMSFLRSKVRSRPAFFVLPVDVRSSIEKDPQNFGFSGDRRVVQRRPTFFVGSIYIWKRLRLRGEIDSLCYWIEKERGRGRGENRRGTIVGSMF